MVSAPAPAKAANPDKRLRALSAQVAAMDERLQRIERRLGMATPEPEPVEEPTSARTTAAPAKRVTSSAGTPRDENAWFKIFGAVGFVFILIGLFYLYKWGVEQGLLTYGVRVAIGTLAGIACTAGGELVRRKHSPLYGQLLMGGGIAITYFSIYAAYYFPVVRDALGMSLLLDTVLLFLVTVGAVWLALRADSKLLTAFAFFLGYLTAFVLPRGHLSIITAIVLSAGLWFILWRARWNFGYAPVLAAYLVYLSNFSALTTGGSSGPVIAFAYAGVIFFLFATLTVRYGASDDAIAISIAVINGLCMLFAGLSIANEYFPLLKGLFVVVLAGVHFLAWLVADSLRKPRAANAFLILAIAFLAIAIPVQLERSWITILWAVQGALLIMLGLKYDRLGVRATAYGVLALAFLKAFCIDS